MGKRALCVGINNFQNYPGAALNGCINDSNDMKDILTTYLGFQGSDITTLTDAQATKKAIMDNLNSMIADAKAGKLDYLVFSFSSHGTQVPDTNHDEPDFYDEAFCTYDLAEKNGQWDTNHIIIDDELHDLFIQLPPNVLLEVYMDTCHSGTGLKGIDLMPGRKPRYLPPPSLGAYNIVAQSSPRSTLKASVRGLTHHILWAGCKSNETSSDASIAGNYHGAFTYYLCHEIRASQNKDSRAVLWKKVIADLKANHFAQNPQLECNATKRKATLP